ncbi:His/Gly/Thr/Pro-type tRNA ligase C-terminal domain-containing protein [Pseudomonas sp. FP1740]|uniref:His/Gly/Thr/Pro-type tRNA ligase C-terminal domain-containing protein n=1 Tax=Pseudomonas sp. FP1740 TaxID=2954078 RepID=UPI002736678B|nr:His/Gly/Thr/Pro-type tRNA ligase C-terminal domain-containing protein [Pseudomonas sp. FP1740]WLG44980.1 His/Gly/Thr/Pro-type tRNA ligase C-terminal domain-containing protein [Pseudomonas sp. FP1740]
MIHITLPDGSLREYDQPLSVYEVAASISLGLANAAVAGRVDGVLVDCGFLIECDARVSIVTSQEPDGLEILRRSCALMLAMAVKQLHPNAQLRAGSVLGDGFFYEFAFRRSLTLAALPMIEARMRALAATNHSIRRQEPASRATSSEGLSLYRLGGFEGFAEGPHVPTTKVLQAFALDHISGTLQQRIYGTCWSSQQELNIWRAPPLVMVVNIDERQSAYAHSVTETLRRRGLRANSDLRNEKISHKIRQHSQKVPYLLVVGEKERDGGFVSMRSGSGEDFGEQGIEAVCELLSQPKTGGA